MRQILYLAILIVAAKLFGKLMHRIHQPTIIENVLAGVIVCPVGIISKRKIEKFDKKTHDAIILANTMFKKFHTASPDEHLYSVIQKMISHPFDIIPIIDPKNENLVGIVTNQSYNEFIN